MAQYIEPKGDQLAFELEEYSEPKANNLILGLSDEGTEVNSERSFKTTAYQTANNERGFSVSGKVNTTSERNIGVIGSYSVISERAFSVNVKDNLASDVSFSVAGSIESNSEREFSLKTQSTLGSERGFELSTYGGETSDRAFEISVIDSIDSTENERDIEIEGTTDVWTIQRKVDDGEWVEIESNIQIDDINGDYIYNDENGFEHGKNYCYRVKNAYEYINPITLSTLQVDSNIKLTWSYSS